jgi:D-serine dehydratase
MFTSDLKGFPLGQAPLQRAEVAGQGWRVLQGDLPLPLAVLKGSALAHNLAWMQRFCDERGLSLAPHGKTTLSPELWQRQLDAGAWGISLATLVQVGLGVKHGVPRIVIPNQVVQWAELDALALLQRTAPHTMIWFLVDSLAQVDHIE